MKNLKLKGIILSSIGILSSLILFISLTFCYVYMPISSSLGAIGDITAVNGFSVMGFESAVISEFEGAEILVIIMALCSYFILIASILGIVLYTIALFKNQTIKSPLILNGIASGVYMIIGIVSTIVMNGILTEGIKNLIGLKINLMSTSSFWAVILQALIITGYILCSKLIKEKEETSREKESCSNVKSTINVGEKEKNIILLLKEYKDLYTKGIINIMEFEKKKYTLLFNNKFMDVQIEKDLVGALLEYKKVYEEGIITIDEYEKKKLQLLSLN